MTRHRGLQRKQALLELVKKSPGIGFLEIKKISGYNNEAISHHLKNLEKEKAVRIRREKRKMWIFYSDIDSSDDIIRIYLRKETCMKILRFLSKKKVANFSQIKQTIGKSPSTTSVTLKMLIEKSLVKRKYIKNNTLFIPQYSLANPRKINKILKTIKTSQVDILKDRFADTFSFF